MNSFIVIAAILAGMFQVGQFNFCPSLPINLGITDPLCNMPTCQSPTNFCPSGEVCCEGLYLCGGFSRKPGCTAPAIPIGDIGDRQADQLGYNDTLTQDNHSWLDQDYVEHTSCADLASRAGTNIFKLMCSRIEDFNVKCCTTCIELFECEEECTDKEDECIVNTVKAKGKANKESKCEDKFDECVKKCTKTSSSSSSSSSEEDCNNN